MDDYVYFDQALHLNRFTKTFDLRAEGREHILANLEITIDGSILGIKRACVKPYLKDPEVFEIRIKNKKIDKNFKIESEDDLYKFLAMITPPDQDY